VSDSIVLGCAVLASLAAGVLAAYGVCLGMFGVFQMRAQRVEVRSEAPAAGTARIVEG